MVYDPAWTPTSLPSLTGYWNADDCAGAGGASVASWTDRINGLALAQATGSQQPTIVTNSGSTGHRALRFTAASSQIMTAARGSNPNTGPFYCWVVQRAVSAPAGQRILAEVADNGVTNKGWSAGYNNGVNNPQIVLWGVVGLLGTGGDSTAVNLWREWSYDPVTAHEARTQRDNSVAAVLATSSSQPNAAGTLCVGGGISHAGMHVDSEIMLLLIGAGYPTAADRNSFAWWLYVNYGMMEGTGYNSTAPTTTNGKNNDGTASTTAIELGVLYNSGGIFGSNYWLTWDPFTSAVIDENPNIGFGSDGSAWSSAGISNPVVAYPGGGAAGNNADCALLDNTARDSKLYLYYVRDATTPLSTSGVYVKASTDGLTWGAASQLVVGSLIYECPAVCYDPVSALYWLYTIDTNGSGGIKRQTSSSPTGPFSTPQTQVALTIPGGRTPWHIGTPVKFGARWIFSFSDSDTARNIWLAASTDGLHFTCATRPIIVPNTANWDALSAYRPSIQDAADGVNFYAWYIGYNGAQTTARLSPKVTIPQTEFPTLPVAVAGDSPAGGGFMLLHDLIGV